MQNPVGGFVIEKVTSFPKGSIRGRIVDHTELNGLYKCIDDTGDTSDPSKWINISASGIIFNFGRVGRRLKSQWLRLNGGKIVSAVTGHRLWFRGTLKVISVQTAAFCNARFYIRKDAGGLFEDLDFLYINGNAGGDALNVDKPLIAGDILSCYMEVVSGIVNNPSVNVLIIPT